VNSGVARGYARYALAYPAIPANTSIYTYFFKKSIQMCCCCTTETELCYLVVVVSAYTKVYCQFYYYHGFDKMDLLN
jgi:hypothetical protein